MDRRSPVAALVLLGAMISTGDNAALAGPRRGDAPRDETSGRSPSVGRLLAAEDVLQITVAGDSHISGKYRVAPDGTFDFPYVGRLLARGRTVSELGASIADKLLHLSKPRVTVELAALLPRAAPTP